MPKDKRSCSFSHKSHDFFYKPYSRGKSSSSGGSSLQEEASAVAAWEDVNCPICMESPHNAVLLLCSSFDKGCRPFMCDTSYRHSNCLDQYIRAQAKSQGTASLLLSRGRGGGGGGNSRETTTGSRGGRGGSSDGGSDASDGGSLKLGRSSGDDSSRGLETCKGLDLACPLCRGKVAGWKVVEKVRQEFNMSRRGCAQDSCSFSGSYEDLRKHARYVHPFARPSEIDPVRQREWWRMESQRDLGDVYSTIQSAMPGATIVGDYVIEEGDEDEVHDDDDDDDEEEEDGFDDNGSEQPGNASAVVDSRDFWTMLVLFQINPNSAGGAAASGGGAGAGHAHHHHHHHHRNHHLPLGSSSSRAAYSTGRRSLPVNSASEASSRQNPAANWGGDGGGGGASSSSRGSLERNRGGASSSSASLSARRRRRSSRR